MIKVWHIDSESEYGGGQRQLYFLMQVLKKDPRFEQTLLARDNSPIAKMAAQLGISVINLSQKNDLDIKSAWRLHSLLKKYQPNLVHLHTSRALGVSALAHVLFNLPDIPFIHTRRVAFPIKGLLAHYKYQKGASEHIAISQTCADLLQDIGIDPQRIHLIYSGIEIPKESGKESAREWILQQTGFDADSWIIGGCGNLLPVKRFDWLIRATAKLVEEQSNVRLVLFGEGRCREDLENEVASYGLEKNVCFLGHVEQPERYFGGLDTFVMSSEMEGLGTSLLDAMIREVTVIGANNSGIAEVIEHNESGLLFDTRSEESLYRQLHEVISNKEHSQQLAANARLRVIDKFDVNKNVKQVIALYRQLLGCPIS